MQAFRDLEALKQVDAGETLLLGLGNRLLKVLTDKELAAEFQAIDVSELRAREFLVAVPPPEFAVGCMEDENVCLQFPFVCEICDKKFQDAKSIQLHMRRIHNIQLLSRVVTLTNQCLSCRQVFSTRQNAQRHFDKAMSNGFCNTARVYNLKEVSPISNFDCPLPSCTYVGSDLPDL